MTQESLMDRALAIDEASYGPDHPKVARHLNNLAQLLQATNRQAEAEPLMGRAFTIVWTSLVLDHPNTQTVGGNYIALLQAMGLSESAIQAKLQALQPPPDPVRPREHSSEHSHPHGLPPSSPPHQQPQPPELNYLLMDVANTTQEITSRLTARAFSAITHPEQGPALREEKREWLGS